MLGLLGRRKVRTTGNMAKMKNPSVAEKRRDLLVEMKKVKKSELKKMQMTPDRKRGRPL